MKRILAACFLYALLLCACGIQPQDTAPTIPPQPASAPPSVNPTSAMETWIVEPEPTPVPVLPRDDELVRVQDYLPEIRVDLRYAGIHNFTATVIYDFSDAWLRYGTVRKLQTAQESLRAQGFDLLIWDAYRPQEAQYRLWEVTPDPVYVANPYTGHSSHSNGGTVDITLVAQNGEAVEMPSGFDEFSELSDRDYRDVSPAAAEHAQILERAMTDAGFVPYAGEWWHYADSDTYPYEDLASVRLPASPETRYTVACEEPICLCAEPSCDAEVLVQIPIGSQFTVLGFAGVFARISFLGRQGYVLQEFIKRDE